jgi:hypothetical protein
MTSPESRYRSTEVRARLADERKADPRTKVFTPAQLRRMREALADGVTQEDVCSMFRIQRTTLRQLMKEAP